MSTFDEDIRTRIAPFANPLEGAAPTGSDLSYDPEFERVAAEIEKLSNLSGGSVDWMLIADDSKRMLSERTKDLRLAGWMTLAKAQRDGWRGVAEGLFATQALVDTYWDNMFPPAKRARARASVFTWLWEALDKMLTARAVTAADADAIKALETLVSVLDEQLNAKLGDLNPGVGRFRSVVREKVRALPAPAPPPPPPKTEEVAAAPAASTNGTAAAVQAAPVAAAPPPPMPDAPAIPIGGSLEELHDAASKWQEGLRALGLAARATAPADAWGYRLLRAATWLTVDGTPEVNADKRTYVRAPSPADRTALTNVFESSNWAALVDLAEDFLTTNYYWLDLHRSEAVALERLNLQEARDAVGREAVAFAARMPGIEELEFANGTPFASPETREWLGRERARWGGGGVSAGGAPAAGGGGGSALAPAVVEALAGAGNGSDASIAKLIRAAEGGDARSRFVGRLEVARIALDKERTELALDVAELLLPDITETLEAWEPALAADALAQCLRALKTRNAEEQAADGRESLLFRRLLKLDPEAALRLRSSN